MSVLSGFIRTFRLGTRIVCHPEYYVAFAPDRASLVALSPDGHSIASLHHGAPLPEVCGEAAWCSTPGSNPCLAAVDQLRQSLLLIEIVVEPSSRQVATRVLDASPLPPGLGNIISMAWVLGALVLVTADMSIRTYHNRTFGEPVAMQFDVMISSPYLDAVLLASRCTQQAEVLALDHASGQLQRFSLLQSDRVRSTSWYAVNGAVDTRAECFVLVLRRARASHPLCSRLALQWVPWPRSPEASPSPAGTVSTTTSTSTSTTTTTSVAEHGRPSHLLELVSFSFGPGSRSSLPHSPAVRSRSSSVASATGSSISSTCAVEAPPLLTPPLSLPVAPHWNSEVEGQDRNPSDADDSDAFPILCCMDPQHGVLYVLDTWTGELWAVSLESWSVSYRVQQDNFQNAQSLLVAADGLFVFITVDVLTFSLPVSHVWTGIASSAVRPSAGAGATARDLLLGGNSVHAVYARDLTSLHVVAAQVPALLSEGVLLDLLIPRPPSAPLCREYILLGPNSETGGGHWLAHATANSINNEAMQARMFQVQEQQWRRVPCAGPLYGLAQAARSASGPAPASQIHLVQDPRHPSSNIHQLVSRSKQLRQGRKRDAGTTGDLDRTDASGIPPFRVHIDSHVFGLECCNSHIRIDVPQEYEGKIMVVCTPPPADTEQKQQSGVPWVLEIHQSYSWRSGRFWPVFRPFVHAHLLLFLSFLCAHCRHHWDALFSSLCIPVAFSPTSSRHGSPASGGGRSAAGRASNNLRESQDETDAEFAAEEGDPGSSDILVDGNVEIQRSMADTEVSSDLFDFILELALHFASNDREYKLYDTRARCYFTGQEDEALRGQLKHSFSEFFQKHFSALTLCRVLRKTDFSLWTQLMSYVGIASASVLYRRAVAEGLRSGMRLAVPILLQQEGLERTFEEVLVVSSDLKRLLCEARAYADCAELVHFMRAVAKENKEQQLYLDMISHILEQHGLSLIAEGMWNQFAHFSRVCLPRQDACQLLVLSLQNGAELLQYRTRSSTDTADGSATLNREPNHAALPALGSSSPSAIAAAVQAKGISMRSRIWLSALVDEIDDGARDVSYFRDLLKG